ncbi:hypothetical protein JW906_01495 [bacterium]|nr:hypothetical protein [bacterium]
MKKNRAVGLWPGLAVLVLCMAAAPCATADVFNFDQGNLQGWTMQGIYAYETYPAVYANPFSFLWSDKTQHPGAMDGDPMGNSAGSALAIAVNFDLPAGYPSGASYWFIDLVSPDVTSDPQWQNMTGVSAEIYTLYPQQDIWIQVLLNATRKSDGGQTWLRETLHGDFIHELRMRQAGWKSIMAAHFTNLGNYTINNVRFRIFGDPDKSYDACKFYFDNVTPLAESPSIGLKGRIEAGVAAEGCDYILAWFESDLLPAPHMTRLRIDFTGSNVEIGALETMLSPDCPQITNLVKISDRILEITFSGFDIGEWIEIVPDLDQHHWGSGSPLGNDYVGATAYLTFDNMPAEVVMPLEANFVHKSEFEAIAPFSYDPFSNLPPPPSDLRVRMINDQLHVTWQDHSNNETGFRLERLITPAPMPVQWSELAVLDSNVTSFQMDNPVPKTTYNFRVTAFNDEGDSGYSDPVSFYCGYSLEWLAIDEPAGGEVWTIGSTQQIRWRNTTFAIAKPLHVDIHYSTDGGSNWVSPPIAEGILNLGSYSWTIPDTPSDRCVVRVEDAADGSPYDLSNRPFTIQADTEPLLSYSPDTLDFGYDQYALPLDIQNIGGGTLTWSVSAPGDKPWIVSIAPPNGSGAGTVTVNVDRVFFAGDTDEAELDITSNGGSGKVTVLIVQEQHLLPGHWDHAVNTGNNATVILPVAAGPNIEGEPLENGDYIGVFTPAGLCCGWSQWEGTNCSITAWGDDSQTPATDGFLAGETIGFRVFRSATQDEWDSVVTGYSVGTGLYAADALMVLNRFDVSAGVTLTLQFSLGWNLFSIRLDPFDPALDAVMAPVVDDLVMVKNGQGKTYIPEFGINDIGDMDFRQGYKAYFDQPAALDVQGTTVPAETSINLAQGWNMIAYLPADDMPVEQALAGINDILVIAKNNAGQTYLPLFGINTIGRMEPGQGYQVCLSSAGTLVYPSPGMPRIAEPAVTVQQVHTEHYLFTANTGENATVIIPVDAGPGYSDGSLLSVGDEIGVFTASGACCGATVWAGVNAAITVWGDDAITDSIDGFTEGDSLRFRVWKADAGADYPARVAFREGDPAEYTQDGVSVLTSLIAQMPSGACRRKGNGIPDDFGLSVNHPNPFNSATVIDFRTPQTADILLTIHDLSGHEVRRLVEGTNSAGCYSARWDGKDVSGNRVASGVYIYKVEIRGKESGSSPYRNVRKMIFVK